MPYMPKSAVPVTQPPQPGAAAPYMPKSAAPAGQQIGGPRPPLASGLSAGSEQQNKLEAFRDYQPSADRGGVKNFATGMLQSQYRNVGKEDNIFTKFARGISNVAPVVGSTLAGAIGGITGKATGDVAAGAGFGAGQALGESIENLAGIQNELPNQLAKEAVVKPIETGALSSVTRMGMEGAGKLLSPFVKAGKGIAKGAFRMVVPKDASSKQLASIFRLRGALAENLKPVETSNKVLNYRDAISGKDLEGLMGVSDDILGKIDSITKGIVSSTDEAIDAGDAISAASAAKGKAFQIQDKTAKSTLDQVRAMIDASVKTSGKSINQLSPTEALNLERQLNHAGYALDDAAESALGGSDKIKLQQQSKIFIDAAKSIGKKLEKVADQTGRWDTQQIGQYLDELSSIDPKLAQDVSAAIQRGSIKEIRSLMSPWVRLKEMSRRTIGSEYSPFSAGPNAKGTSVVDLVRGVVNRPEAATAMSAARRELSESPVGSAVGAATGAAGNIMDAFSKVAPKVIPSAASSAGVELTQP